MHSTLGRGKPYLKPDELLAEILIPKESLGKPTHFLKFGLRKGQALSLVNVAASFWVNWDKNTFVAPRIALGAVAPKIIHATKAEAYLEGLTITPGAMAEAGAPGIWRREAHYRLPRVCRLPPASGRGPHKARPRTRLYVSQEEAIGRN